MTRDRTLRGAALADAAGLAHLHVTCWRETYGGMVPEPLLAQFSPERSHAVWSRLLADPAAYHATRVMLAECGGALVGFASCGAQRTPELAAKAYDGEVSTLYVLRSSQRQGFGAHLLDALAADLIGRGFKAASLWVHRDNTPAQRFYERCGGYVVGSKQEVHDQAVLPEIAYGWPDLRALRATLLARLA